MMRVKGQQGILTQDALIFATETEKELRLMKKIFTKDRAAGWLKANWPVLLFFVCFLLYGLATVKDYGVSTDEVIERESSLAAYKYMVPSVSDIVTDSVDFTQVPELKDYVYRYYGVAVQLPMVFVEHLFGFQLDIRKVFLMRHLANFLAFFLASVFFYLTCRLFTKQGNSDRKSRYLSLFGTALFLLSPIILANAYYNIKDMMFLSTFAVSFYFGLSCIQKTSWPRLIGLAFSAALCTNVRIVGAIVIAVSLILLFIRKIREGEWKPVFFKCLATGLLCFAFYFAMTPVIWENTIEEIGNLIGTFSNYLVWYAYTFFMGKYILSTELPWYYLFVCIGITTPLLHLAGFFAGVVHQGKDAAAVIGKKAVMTERGWFRIALLLNLAIPFAYVLVSRPVLYNSWRHFFFIYPLLALYALDDIVWLGKMAGKAGRKWVKYGFCAAVGGSVLFLAGWIGVNHPYEYAYFNRPALPFVNHYFQKDYWNVSHYELLQNACDRDQRETLKVWMLPFETSSSLLRPEDRSRVVHEDDQAMADYIVTAYTDYWENERIAQYYLYDELKAVTVDGIKLSSLFGRAYDITSRSAFYRNEDGKTRCNEIGMDWEKTCQDGMEVLEGAYEVPVLADKVWIQDQDGKDVSDVRIWVSEDGEHFEEIPMAPEYSVLTADSSGTFSPGTLTHIRLAYPEGSHQNLICSVLKHRDEPGTAATWQVRVVKQAISDYTPWEAVYMVDGENETRWTSGQAQQPGISVQFALTDTFTISGVHVDTGNTGDDYPRNLRIYVSRDGENWTDVQARAEDQETYLFQPAECSYVKLELGTWEEPVENNWSVFELDLLTEVPEA